jgi:6-pyruvoyltetrahydropterin/6-carboxytetrahydropterin synthase
MIIRKEFKFEGAHIVRNCSSDRCKFSIHGHSYRVEVKLTSKGLDNGQMVLDFGLMKGTIKDVVDAFDHCYAYWDKESEEFINFIHKYSARWIALPYSPSAESLSIMFLYLVKEILKNTEFNNGEKDVEVHSVVVHETATGYAEAFVSDLDDVTMSLKDFVFSDAVKAEWKNPNMIEDIKNGKKFVNNKVVQQV